jgi:hypothetical protein
MNYIDSLGITRLDFVICTHFHSDHAGALPSLIDKYCNSSCNFIYNPISDNAISSIANEVKWKTAEYKANVISKANEKGMYLATPNNGTVYNIDSNTKFIVYKSSVANGFSDYNRTSLAVVFQYKGKKYLLSGDINIETQKELYSSIGKCDVVKDAHHGYNSNIDIDFIKTTNPKDIIVTRAYQFATNSSRACNSVGMWQSYNKNIYSLHHVGGHIVIDCINNDYVINTSKKFYFENCWLKFNNNNSTWCYFKSGGDYAKNEILTLDGKKYEFDSNGYCVNPYNPR